MISEDRAINNLAASLTSEPRFKLILRSSLDSEEKNLLVLVVLVLLVLLHLFLCGDSEHSWWSLQILDVICLSLLVVVMSNASAAMAFLAFLCLIPQALHNDCSLELKWDNKERKVDRSIRWIYDINLY